MWIGLSAAILRVKSMSRCIANFFKTLCESGSSAKERDTIDWQIAFRQLPVFCAVAENLHWHDIFSFLITCKSTLVHRKHRDLRMAAFLHFGDYSPYCFAASKGNIDAMNWMYERTIVKPPRNGIPICITSCAAKTGHVEVFEWLNERGILPNESAVSEAVVNRHLELVGWLAKRGYRPTVDDFDFAAIRQDIAVLEWLFTKGCRGSDELADVLRQENANISLEWMQLRALLH
jgi:hypothetical protein